MPNDELDLDAERLLAAMDFAAMTALQQEKQRKEMVELLRGILEVVDSLEALETLCRELTESGQSHVPLRSVSVIVRQALQVLVRSGVAPMNAVGNKLDLDLHEVVAVSETSQWDADMIVEEMMKGYLWNGRLLRRAKVTVSNGGGQNQVTTG